MPKHVFIIVVSNTVFCLLLLVSLLERHSCLHDPLCHVVLRWNHCWNPLFCPLFSLWEVQSLLCCWHHVLCFKWVGGGHEYSFIHWCSGPTCASQLQTWTEFLKCTSLCPEALFVLLAMAIYTGVTVNFLGKRFGDWRFSWSYILGWVALLMTFFAGLFSERVHYIVFSVLLKCGWCSFTCVCGEAIEFTSSTCTVKIQLHYNYLVTYFAGIFYMCAYRMHECRRVAGPRWTGTEVPWVERFPNAIQMQSICCQIIKFGTLLKPFLLTLTNKIFLLLDRDQTLKKEVEQSSENT